MPITRKRDLLAKMNGLGGRRSVAGRTEMEFRLAKAQESMLWGGGGPNKRAIYWGSLKANGEVFSFISEGRRKSKNIETGSYYSKNVETKKALN